MFQPAVKYLLFALFIVNFSTGLVLGEEGELTPELIRQLQDGFELDTQTQVTQNAVTNNSIDKLALNRGILRGHNGHFSHKIKFNGITNQGASGRCWLFAGLNTMRPIAMKNAKLEKIELSAAYLHFWDKLEKSNLFLEYMIEMRDTDYLDREWELVHKWTLGDGGWWNYVVDLVDKYGVVPEDVMPGTYSSENTRRMNTVLERKLRHDAVALHSMHQKGSSIKELRAYKQNALAEVYRFLVINIGEPPRQFEWRYEVKPEKSSSEDDGKADDDENEDEESVENKNLASTGVITPKQFYQKFVDLKLNDYVCLYNDQVNPYLKHYQFKRSKNMVGRGDMNFVNIPIDQMKQIAMNSVVDNRPVWFAADVGKDQSSEHGIMAADLFEYGPLFDLDLSISKADQVKYRGGTSNHAMVFMGVDVKDGHPAKWLVENSWGEKNGHKGVWTLYDDWFNRHMYVIIVHKDHVPQKIMQAFEQPAQQLPAWYPGAAGVE
ncbi:MAG: aminopeptidase C [Pirellulales bacterium]